MVAVTPQLEVGSEGKNLRPQLTYLEVVRVVFTAGSSLTGDGTSVPCYWQNATKVDLPGGDGSAYSIAAANGTPYVAGSTRTDPKSFPSACYWAGTTRHELNVPAAPGKATSIALE